MFGMAISGALATSPPPAGHRSPLLGKVLKVNGSPRPVPKDPRLRHGDRRRSTAGAEADGTRPGLDSGPQICQKAKDERMARVRAYVEKPARAAVSSEAAKGRLDILIANAGAFPRRRFP